MNERKYTGTLESVCAELPAYLAAVIVGLGHKGGRYAVQVDGEHRLMGVTYNGDGTGDLTVIARTWRRGVDDPAESSVHPDFFYNAKNLGQSRTQEARLPLGVGPFVFLAHSGAAAELAFQLGRVVAVFPHVREQKGAVDGIG